MAKIERNFVTDKINIDVFANFKLAIEQHSLAPLEHDMQNLLLFIPLGFLIPLVNLEKCKNVGSVCLTGIFVSTWIETIQLLWHLGECDINDVISNSVGALAGYGLCIIFLHINKNRTLWGRS